MTEDLASFRSRVDAFFVEHATPKPSKRGWAVGPDAVVSSGLARDDHDATDLDSARAFQSALYDANLAWLRGPKDCGGAEATDAHVRAFLQVASQYTAPDTSVFMIGQRIVAPAIAAFGTPRQQKQWLGDLWSGTVIGCQLFSEPDAGSDLASLRCRAVRDGDGWRINGQKVWSSGAHHASVGELLTRTDPDSAARNRGLTMFLVDMASPGITVKPLRQMNGNSHFNEVFFEDVFVPDDGMLGELGQGWAVANASLSSERDLDPDEAGLFIRPVQRLLEAAAHVGLSDNPVIRQRLADAYTRERVGRWMGQALAASTPAVAAVAASITKLYEASSIWDLAQTASSVIGPGCAADDGSWGLYCWSDVVLSVHSQRIAGGTDEIQRNIIGERGLGLPREPR